MSDPENKRIHSFIKLRQMMNKNKLQCPKIKKKTHTHTHEKTRIFQKCQIKNYDNINTGKLYGLNILAFNADSMLNWQERPNFNSLFL